MDNIVERIKTAFGEKVSTMEKRVDAGLAAMGLPGQSDGKFTVVNADDNGEDPDTKCLPQAYFANSRSDRMITGSGEGPVY